MNPIFRDLPDALTSTSIILDSEASIHDTCEKLYLIQTSTNNYDFFLEKLATESVDPKTEGMRALIDKTRYNFMT